MSVAPLTEDQRDALQEVTNIAMGQAASQLAQILATFINLSVPRIQVLTVADLPQAVMRMVGEQAVVTAIRQSFHGDLRGEAIVLYGQEGCTDLADLMGYDDELDAAAERELLLDVGNVLTGAILLGISELLQSKIAFSAPTLMAQETPIDTLIQPKNLTWSYALLVEVNFTLEERGFACHLMMLMPEDAIERTRNAVESFMANF